ncbi:MAG TPA: hypothetical protein VE863_18045 [Pyrinomonadaceae bacterium]|jgi:hypothetical protein|nr:hypothetical protein [Pyrinomonadaceae bacterium]
MFIKRVALPIISLLFVLSASARAQTTKPRLRKPPPRTNVAPLIPVGTNLKIRLNDSLSSKESRAGDKFTATAIDPVRFNEATVHGHIRSIIKSGKVQGRTTMNLSFDSIDLPGDPPKHGVLHGYVTKVYGTNSRSDQEGGVQSESRGKQTLKRGGIGATAGAIIGGIAGGGKGAAIGLIIGGAGGAGSLAINGHKELRLESGTEMLVHVTR